GVALGERSVGKTAADGAFTITPLIGPDVAIISAAGFLTEPVAIGSSDAGAKVVVRLLSDHGGKRFVVHSAGDAMFGRRYETPREGDPMIPVGNQGPAAEAVISSVRPAFLAADFRTLNLETVLTDRSDLDAYPHKRYIIRSRPGTVS